MFFDKLWVRIKGELLTFKDDFPGAREIRQKGEQLLEELERRWQGLAKGKQEAGSSDAYTEKTSEREPATHLDLKDIEREWDELLKLREQKKQNSKDDGPPNPRTLG